MRRRWLMRDWCARCDRYTAHNAYDIPEVNRRMEQVGVVAVEQCSRCRVTRAYPVAARPAKIGGQKPA